MRYLIAAVALLACAGCQHVAKIEFYEPTEANQAYCVPATSRSVGRGPVKSIEGKSGSPDFGENTTFSMDFSFLNL